jgi:hypothetical protein
MELSGWVKQGNVANTLWPYAQVVALTRKGPNVTVLAHAESPLSAPDGGSSDCL